MSWLQLKTAIWPLISRSLGHSVTRSLNHLINGHFSHSYGCLSLGNDQQKYEWRKWPEVIEWSSDQITKWPAEIWVTEWQSDQVTEWQIERVTKWLSDRVTKWLNDLKWLSKKCLALFKEFLYTIWKRRGESLKILIQHLWQWHKLGALEASVPGNSLVLSA